MNIRPFAASLLIASAPAFADPVPSAPPKVELDREMQVALKEAPSYDLWLASGMFSKHVNTTKSYNELNWGVGLRLEQDPSRGPWGAEAGYYYNSRRQDSFYLAGTWRPSFLTIADEGRDLRLSLGAVAGLVTGYSTRSKPAYLKPMLAPTLTLQWGAFAVDGLWFPEIKGVTPQTFAIRFRARLASW